MLHKTLYTSTDKKYSKCRLIIGNFQGFLKPPLKNRIDVCTRPNAISNTTTRISRPLPTISTTIAMQIIASLCSIECTNLDESCLISKRG